MVMEVRLFAGVELYHPQVELIQEIRNDLTMDNPAYAKAARFSPWGPPRNIPKQLHLYRAYDDGTYVVPRAWQNLQAIGIDKDDRVEAPTEWPELVTALNTDQEEGLLSFDPAGWNGCNLVVLPPSSGKTILAAAMAAETGQKTLVLVHTQFIQRGWISDTFKAFGFRPGIIQADTCDTSQPLTVGMLQTFWARPKLWLDLQDTFGTIVVDECQITPARTFSELVSASPAKYRIGITATPSRGDGLARLVYEHFGSPVINRTSTNEETDTAMAISDVVVHETGFTPIYMDTDPWAEVLHQQSFHDPRNNMIVEAVVQEWRAGHSCLVACRLKSHVGILSTMLNARGVPLVQLTADFSRKDLERRESQLMRREIRVAVATIALIQVGASINPLDRLFLAGTVGNRPGMIQLVGRIRRKADGKTDAVVHDFADGGVLRGQFKGRVDLYRKFGIAKFERARVITPFGTPKSRGAKR